MTHPLSLLFGDSGGIQTHNLLIRSQMLYSVELRNLFRFAGAKVRTIFDSTKHLSDFFRKIFHFGGFSGIFVRQSPAFCGSFREIRRDVLAHQGRYLVDDRAIHQYFSSFRISDMRWTFLICIGTSGRRSTFWMKPISESIALTPAGLPSTKRSEKRSVKR